MKMKKLVKNLTNYLTLTLTLFFTLSLPIPATATDPCQMIVIKAVKPPPAVKILNEIGDHTLLDPKEKFELTRQYREAILKLTDLLGKYIELRQKAEKTRPYLSWQWERVKAGIEYKKDIWEKEIKELLPAQAELRNIERQLLMLGISQADLDACYRASR